MKNLYNCTVYLQNKIENIVAKGEIACFEQFLLLLQFFQKSSAADALKYVYMRERFNDRQTMNEVIASYLLAKTGETWL